MNYNINETEMQLSFEISPNFLKIPYNLESLNNTDTIIGISKTGRTVYCFNGDITIKDEERYCLNCSSFMHIKGHTNTNLRHLCFGSNLTCLKFLNPQLFCHNCNHTKMNPISFKTDNNHITKELYDRTIKI